MNNIRTILIAVAVVLGAIFAIAAIGTIILAMKYLFWLAVICVAGVVAVKVFAKPDARRLESKSTDKTLNDAERTLEEYKRKLLVK